MDLNALLFFGDADFLLGNNLFEGVDKRNVATWVLERLLETFVYFNGFIQVFDGFLIFFHIPAT